MHHEKIADMSILVGILIPSRVFSSETCDPTLHAASVFLILFIYCCLSVPLLIVCLIIFCLPCVAIFLPVLVRYFPESEDERGASQDQLNSLQLKTYAPGDYEDEDANCCICLENYTAGAELHVLPCAHHFHKVCLGHDHFWCLVSSPSHVASRLPETDACPSPRRRALTGG